MGDVPPGDIDRGEEDLDEGDDDEVDELAGATPRWRAIVAKIRASWPKEHTEASSPDPTEAGRAHRAAREAGIRKEVEETAAEEAERLHALRHWAAEDVEMVEYLVHQFSQEGDWNDADPVIPPAIAGSLASWAAHWRRIAKMPPLPTTAQFRRGLDHPINLRLVAAVERIVDRMDKRRREVAAECGATKDAKALHYRVDRVLKKDRAFGRLVKARDAIERRFPDLDDRRRAVEAARRLVARELAAV